MICPYTRSLRSECPDVPKDKVTRGYIMMCPKTRSLKSERPDVPITRSSGRVHHDVPSYKVLEVWMPWCAPRQAPQGVYIMMCPHTRSLRSEHPDVPITRSSGNVHHDVTSYKVLEIWISWCTLRLGPKFVRTWTSWSWWCASIQRRSLHPHFPSISVCLSSYLVTKLLIYPYKHL